MGFPPSRLLTLAAGLLWASLVALGVASPSMAQDASDAAFSLQATVSERPRLSRDEIDPTAVGLGNPVSQMPFGGATMVPVEPTVAFNMIPPPVAPMMPQVAAPGHAPAAKPRAPQSQVPARAAAPLAAHAQAGGQDELMSVDWSLWMTHVADRWFFNLKHLENMYGREFHSPRAAQVRFTCYPNGTIGNISLEQSSGIDAYDQMQIQSLVQTMPLAPFPPGSQRKSVTLVQGWEAHPRRPGEQDFRPGSFGQGFPQEKVNKWTSSR